MAKVYGFDEAGYRRVVEATRRILGTARKGAQQRRQSPVLSGDGRQLCLVKPMATKSAPAISECAVYTGPIGSWSLNGDTLIGYSIGYDLDPAIWWIAEHMSAYKGFSAGGGTSSVSADSEHPSGTIGPAEYLIFPAECS